MQPGLPALPAPPAQPAPPGLREADWGAISGSVLFLSKGTVAPSGYTKLGTDPLIYEGTNRLPKVLDLDIYVKN